jgi:hypothetical protein
LKSNKYQNTTIDFNINTMVIIRDNIKISALILLLLFANLIYAQPGGGGGLKIKNFFDKNFNKINLDKDSIEIAITLLDSNLTIMNKVVLKTPSSTSVYLSPLNHYSYSSNTQGLLIKYKNENYRIDFENILSENGAGYKEEIDSLVLFKPYILSKRNYYHPTHDGNESRKFGLLNALSSINLKRGITPHTYKKLFDLDLMFDTLSFANNGNTKVWMEDFKNLYDDYQQSNFTHNSTEINYFLKRLDKIIVENAMTDAFVYFKIILLNEVKAYAKIVSLFEEYPFEYDYNQYYINNILINAYKQNKAYDKAILLSNTVARNIKEIDREWFYRYVFDRLFLQINYQDKNIGKELHGIINNETYWNYYSKQLTRFKILKAFNTYKFENELQGIKEIKQFDLELIPSEIKQSMKIPDEIKQSTKIY